ncbi:winged helix-turn-helix domain-containing protein (plasmid) [Pantoea sp. BJ2]|uniref:Winged helix-turn-helix domain-containing protein n=1 Tax=Pantoea sp. BJ2 TaxID=3141322 RepID=A0AAU7U458_9GAMM
MYLIDKKVYFTYSTGKLSNLDDEIILGEHARECLMLLIEKKGEIVSKATIVSRVWNAKGIVVSDNAVRQTMHILRRSLLHFTEGSQVITTVPRNGYLINNVAEVPDDDTTLSNYRVKNDIFTRASSALVFARVNSFLPGIKGITYSFLTASLLFIAHEFFHPVNTAEPLIQEHSSSIDKMEFSSGKESSILQEETFQDKPDHVY